MPGMVMAVWSLDEVVVARERLMETGAAAALRQPMMLPIEGYELSSDCALSKSLDSPIACVE